jgi:hypothetical protein
MYHAMPMPRFAVVLRSRFQNGMVEARQGLGMACVNYICIVHTAVLFQSLAGIYRQTQHVGY